MTWNVSLRFMARDPDGIDDDGLVPYVVNRCVEAVSPEDACEALGATLRPFAWEHGPVVVLRADPDPAPRDEFCRFDATPHCRCVYVHHPPSVPVLERKP